MSTDLGIVSQLRSLSQSKDKNNDLVTNPRPTIPGLSLISIADFDDEMKDVGVSHSQKEADKKSNQSPKPKKLKPSPPSPSPSNADPVPLPTKPKSQWVAKLNTLAQTHRLVAQFDFAEPALQSFSATLTLFNGEDRERHFTTGNVFSRSKKEAKELVAEQGVTYLSTRQMPTKSAEILPSSSTQEVDKSENWVGLVTHYCQTSSVPRPSFKEYQCGNSALFSVTCTLTLPERGDVVFGEPTQCWPSKKAAKTNAAKAAVQFLRREDMLPLKPVMASSSSSTPSSIATTPTPHLPPFNEQNSSSVSPSPSSPFPCPLVSASSSASSSSPQKATTQVMSLCATLSISPPQYEYTTSTSSSASSPGAPETAPLPSFFYDCAALFPHESDPRLAGPVGRVGRVEKIFGKKRTREECAKRVLVVLEEIRDRRLAEFDKAGGRG